MYARPSPPPARLTYLYATLASHFRVLAEVNRNRPPITPLESTIGEALSVTPLECALTKKRGGGLPPNRPAYRSLLPPKDRIYSLCFQRFANTFRHNRGYTLHPSPAPFPTIRMEQQPRVRPIFQFPLSIFESSLTLGPTSWSGSTVGFFARYTVSANFTQGSLSLP